MPRAAKTRPAPAPNGEAAPDAPRQLTFSDLDMSRWKEYEDVETDSLWIIPSRANGNGHAFDYHGNYVPQIATQLLTRFTRTDDVVLDLFLGSGTTAIEAAHLGRRCIGVDLKADLVAQVSEKVSLTICEDRAALLPGDSASDVCREQIIKTLDKWHRERAQFLLLHPPYHDIIRFSQLPEDLSNAPDTDAFMEMFRRVVANGYALLETGRYAAVIIGDKYAKGELIPLGFYCMQAMQDAGFRLKSIVVKNIAGNEKGKGRDANLWRYRALKGGFYLFKHEYIILCQKPL